MPMSCELFIKVTPFRKDGSIILDLQVETED